MKRLITIVLIAVMLSGNCMAVIAADTVYDYKKEIKFVRMLGLMPFCDYNNFDINQPVLRENYISLLSRISHDLTTDKSGMVTRAEVIEQMVDLLGYRPKAKATSYIVVASGLGMLKNVNYTQEGAVTNGEVAAILYNSSKIKLMEISSAGDTMTYITANKTFLSDILGYAEFKGILEDNGFTALDGKSTIGADYIQVDGEVLRLLKDKKNIRDSIGQRVYGYKSNDEKEDIQTVAAIELDEDDTQITFEMRDFESLNGRNLKYTSAEKAKSVVVSLSATPYIIYNGKYEKSLTTEFFNYDCGSVKLLKSKENSGKDYDIIIIEGYISWCISSVDYNQQTVYPSLTDSPLENQEKTLELNDSDLYLRMYDSDMDAISINELYANNVIDICKNDGAVKIIKAGPIQFDVLISQYDDDKYYSGDTEYTISKYYAGLSGVYLPQLNEYCNLYVNHFGTIIKAEVGSNLPMKVGLLIKLKEVTDSSFDLAGEIKLLTTDNTIEIFETADKIMYTNAQNISARCAYKELYKLLKNNQENTIMQYRQNADGKITVIRLPAAAGTSRKSGQLGCILSGKSLYYETSKYNLEGQAIVSDSESKVFSVSKTAVKDSDKYTLLNISALSGTVPVWTAYNTEPGSPFVEYALRVSNDTLTEKSGYTWFGISKIYKGLNSDGDAAAVLEGCKFDGQRPAVAAKFYCEDSILDKVTDTVNSGAVYQVAAGDIVRLKTSGSQVLDMDVLYKCDINNVFNTSGRKGGFAGNLGYFDSSNTAKSNPFVLDSTANALEGYTVPWRTILGYVYHVDNRGNMTITTQDLSCKDYDANYSGTQFVTEYVAPTSFMNLMNIKDNHTITIRSASTNDVRAYDIVGSKCSRVLVITWYGAYNRVILLNGSVE